MAVLSAELGVAPEQVVLKFRGNLMHIEDKLSDHEIQDQDMLLMSVNPSQGEEKSDSPADGALVEPRAAGGPGGLMGQLSRFFSDPQNRVDRDQLEEMRRRREDIMRARAAAYEISPESFVPVLMLYIDTEIIGFDRNRNPYSTRIPVFVDSGAQQTVMSADTAKRVGLFQLIDTQFAGVARGVGSARILGRIHLAEMRIGGHVYNLSFTVLENTGSPMEVLLGLDMLKKHQCNINLQKNMLEFGDGHAVPFLGEADVPDHAKLH